MSEEVNDTAPPKLEKEEVPEGNKDEAAASDAEKTAPEDGHEEMATNDSEAKIKPEDVKEETTPCDSEAKTKSADTKATDPKELENKIIKQIEYYFGDINMGKDKFMHSITKEDNGWITWETMLKFNRLRDLSDDVEVLTRALKNSTSGLMEISEDGLKIRRSPDRVLPDFNKERREDLKSRSIYAKGFPLDEELDKIIAFFTKFGQTEHVQMRRDIEKKFKGSVFVIYEKLESAKKFIEEPELKYGDQELKKQFKEDYFKLKAESRKKFKEEGKEKKKLEKDKHDEDKEKQFLDELCKGAILDIKNIPKGVKREELKKIFDDHSRVAWVEFDMGDVQGRIRFHEENGAKKALEKALESGEGKIALNETELECSVLEGQEEADHWKMVVYQQKERRDQNKKRSRPGRGRGGRRGQHYDDRGPPFKQQRRF